MNKENMLSKETSPYLLQHSENPVNWHPWRRETFEKAEKEKKPIFLSIGYSACHWCHVMAHESFEDEKIAETLNENFISVKVDREERPDVDQIYMMACQALTGSGGWPLSVFLLPDKRPFFAGTYFPPRDFLRLIKNIALRWEGDGQIFEDGAEELTEAIESMTVGRGRKIKDGDYEGEKQERELAREALRTFRNSFDKRNGGFGRAPKFPSPHNLLFLLGAAPEMAEKTLIQIFKGGISDHIGGGFSRYSTDDRWLVPHFEKMLYDNALLAMAYTLAHERRAGEENIQEPICSIYRLAAERALDYMKGEMLSEGGGFFSAQDADSEGEEGKYYLFSPEEVCKVLGDGDGKEFCRIYDITPAGNWEGKNIPNLLKWEDKEIEDILASGLQQRRREIYEFRKNRVALHTDHKILTGWNSLTAAAFAFAGRIFQRKEYVEEAIKVLDFIEQNLCSDKTLFSAVTSGKTAGPGFLDDFAFYIFAMIQAHKATKDEEYLRKAQDFAEEAIAVFGDENNGGFYFSGRNNEKLLTSVKETYDGAVPSGNSVMMYNLMFLAEKKSGENIEEFLEKHRIFMADEASLHPAGHCFYLFSLFPVKRIECSDGMCRLTDEDVL